MRISSNWYQQVSANAITSQQSKLTHTQLQLSSGKRILSPSEDTESSVKLVNLTQGIALNQQYQDNIVVGRQRLQFEENSLREAIDSMQRIRELGVQGLNASYSQSDRTAIAVEMDTLNQALLGIANQQNANGEYIFAGYKTDTQPYTRTTIATPPFASYTYNGDNNQRSLQVGPGRQITDGDTGPAVFGAVGGSSIFEIIDQFSADLKNNTPATSSLAAIDGALNTMLSTEASIGSRLNAMDKQEHLNSNYILDSQSMASVVGDLDYADAMSKFNLQQVALQAAQQAYTKVQGLTLFNYM